MDYSAELIENCVVFSNFKQLVCTDRKKDLHEMHMGFCLDNYNRHNSLLYVLKSIPIVEFSNGEPDNLISYKMVINLGSSKSLSCGIGILETMIDRSNFMDGNFYSDFFLCHPYNIEVLCCGDTCNCTLPLLRETGTWCNKLLGDLDASNLKIFLHDNINFANIPIYSVIYTSKQTKKIDLTNPKSLSAVINFLNQDYNKIYTLQNKIKCTEDKLELYKKQLTEEKLYYQNNIDKILSDRGNNINSYLALSKDFSDRLDLLNN